MLIELSVRKPLPWEVHGTEAERKIRNSIQNQPADILVDMIYLIGETINPLFDT